MTNPWRRIISAGTALVAAAALAASLGGPAQARADAHPCGEPYPHEVGGTVHTVQICPDWAPDGRIPVYSTVQESSGEIVGYIEAAGPDWYECGLRGDDYDALEGVVNDWWAGTMADNGAWGYVSQVYFRGGGNWEPDANLRRC
ncbi:hypothetical protein HII36_50615 [Nonomuraea sp. NN258]|uniref:hypothetical protein n=1 Tax=Nonomuraea antri TaxID=2730852 RepID=UPI0015689D07|nr:hypothetical protein [Nonomuraea antri]NRQ40026.1 hypothetical protein [Nonomuraea antri]